MEIRTDGRPGWIELTHAGVHVLAKGDDHLRDRLTDAIGRAGGDPLPDVLTDELAAAGVRRAPDFAIVDEPGRRVLVRGAARVLLTAADETTREVVAPARAPWVDEDVDEGTTTAVLVTGELEPVPVESVAASSAGTPESMAPAADPADLDAAVDSDASDEHGAGRPQFVDGHLVGARVAAAAAAVPVEPEPSHPGADQSHDDEDPATGLLPVTGGVPQTQDPGTQEPGEPSTAQLLLSTGEVVDLDRGVLLGRAPRAGAGIGVTGDPRLVRVASPDNEISRSHVEVYLDGGRVIVRDLGSTNGTTLAAPGESARRMTPGEAQPIERGTTIRLAGHVSVVLGDDD